MADIGHDQNNHYHITAKNINIDQSRHTHGRATRRRTRRFAKERFHIDEVLAYVVGGLVIAVVILAMGNILLRFVRPVSYSYYRLVTYSLVH